MIELIVQRYRKELTRYVLLHMHRGKADAEDIVQEVFFALYKKQNISVDETNPIENNTNSFSETLLDIELDMRYTLLNIKNAGVSRGIK